MSAALRREDTVPTPPRAIALPAIALALAATTLAWLLQSRFGLLLSDEGFLWYGAQRTVLGELPYRDFMAYDVGRYYWIAAFLRALGDDGILATRLAAYAFQALAMAAGLACIVRLDARWSVRIAATALLWVWFWPWFRAFDAGASLLSLAAIAWMLMQPGARRYLLAGVVVGVVALIGRNHGLYGGLAAGVAVLIAERWRGTGQYVRAWACLGAGCALGYLPMLLLLAFDPGLREAVLAEMLGMLRAGATNITLPVPWPHRAFAGAAGAGDVLRGVFLGLAFVALPVFTLLGAWRAWRLPPAERARAAAFVAAVLLVPVYAHLAFSRADLSHLASSIAPLLVGVMAWPGAAGRLSRTGLAGLGALLLAGAIVVLPRHPGVEGRLNPKWEDIDVAGDRLRVPPSTARQLRTIAAALPTSAQEPPAVLLAPYMPGGYAAFGLRSPVWENYALWPQPPAFEDAEIARMQAAGVRVAIVEDRSLDGRDELRYRHTHPRIQAWLQEHAERIERERNVDIYHLRAGTAAH